MVNLSTLLCSVSGKTHYITMILNTCQCPLYSCINWNLWACGWIYVDILAIRFTFALLAKWILISAMHDFVLL